MTDSVEKTLQERGQRYGDFFWHAKITQELKRLITSHASLRNKSLAEDQKEALDMICHKIGRIINGDPDYADSWHDIAGYAQLVADRLNTKDISASASASASARSSVAIGSPASIGIEEAHRLGIGCQLAAEHLARPAFSKGGAP